MAVGAVLQGCSFGLRYGGDTRGLRRGEVEDPETGHELVYYAAGDEDAPRLIYIHGAPGRATAWVDYLQDPVDGFESVAVDRLGYAGSRKSGTVRSFHEQAAAIAPLLVERGGRKAIVVAHSLGCPIACRLAAEHPDQIGGLILIGGPLDPSLERLRWYNRAAGTLAVSVALDEKLIVANRELHAAKREELELAPLLGRITCPVTIIHGTRDSLVPYANVGYMLGMLRGSGALRLVPLAGEDHFIPRMDSGVVRREIERMRGVAAADGDAGPY